MAKRTKAQLLRHKKRMKKRKAREYMRRGLQGFSPQGRKPVKQ